jgi:hypothetical protein
MLRAINSVPCHHYLLATDRVAMVASPCAGPECSLYAKNATTLGGDTKDELRQQLSESWQQDLMVATCFFPFAMRRNSADKHIRCYEGLKRHFNQACCGFAERWMILRGTCAFVQPAASVFSISNQAASYMARESLWTND